MINSDECIGDLSFVDKVLRDLTEDLFQGIRKLMFGSDLIQTSW